MKNSYKKYWWILFIILIICREPVFALASQNMTPDYTNDELTVSSDTPIIIDHIFNYDSFITGHMVAQNDTETWNKIVSNWKNVFSFIGAYNDAGDEVALTLESLDTSMVDLETPGHYMVIVHLMIDPNSGLSSSNYQLSDSVQTFSIPICISNPEQFDLFLSRCTPSSSIFSWIKPLSDPITVYYLNSSSPLSNAQLDSASWKVYPSYIQNDLMFWNLSNQSLDAESYHYFYFQSGTECSNYVLISNIAGQWTSGSTGGDRDGGDSTDNPLPDIEQPAPSLPSTSSPADPDFFDNSSKTDGLQPSNNSSTEKVINPDSIGSMEETTAPDSTVSEETTAPNSTASMEDTTASVSTASTEDTTTSVSNPVVHAEETIGSDSLPSTKTSDAVPSLNFIPNLTEKFGKTTDLLSGARLLLMLDTGDGTARFSKQNITITCTRDGLSTYNIQQSDKIQVTIERLEDHSFTFYMSINDSPIHSIRNICYMVPYKAAQKDSFLSVTDSSGATIPIQNYDFESGILTFTTNTTGTFTIQEEITSSSIGNTASQNNNRSTNALFSFIYFIIPIITIGCFFIIIILFLIHKKKGKC